MSGESTGDADLPHPAASDGAALDFLPNPYQMVDADGRLRRVNEAWEDVLGYDREAVRGTAFTGLLTERAQKQYGDAVTRLRQDGTISDLTLAMHGGDGEVHTVELDGRAEYDADGEFQSAHWQFSEVTSQEPNETRLKRLQRAVEAAGYGIYLTDVDGTIEYVNPGFEEITGFSAAEARGSNPRILKSGEMPAQYYEDLWDAILGGEVWHEEIVNNRKNGERYVAKQTIAPVMRDGEVDAFVAIQTDITERKEDERELQEERQKYTTLVEQSHDGVLIVQDGCLEFVNQAIVDLFGESADDLVGRPLLEVIAPEDRDLVRRRYEQRMRGANPPEQYDIEVLTSDGDRRHIDLEVSRIEYEGDPATLATFKDITERKEREQELERYEQLVDHLPIGVYRNTAGPDGEFTLLNDAMVEIFDAEDEADLRTHSVNDLYVDPDEREAFSERLSTDGLVEETDLKLQTVDGEQLWGSVTAIASEIDGRQVFDGAVQDITERKTQETQREALYSATSRFLEAESIDEIATILTDTISEMIGLSRIGVHRFEPDREELVPIAWTDPLAAVIDEPPALDETSLAWEVFQSGSPREFVDLATHDATYNPDTVFETEFIVPLGEFGVLLIASTEMNRFDPRDTQLVEMVCANATAAWARLERERELRGFKKAVEHAGYSIVITDADGTIEYVNPAFEEITGYSQAEAEGRNPRVLKSGEHDKQFYQELWQTILDGEVWQAELINERKDGDRFVVHQTIAPIEENGSPGRFVAVNHDITERKAMEQRLEAQRDNLELLNQVVRHDIRNDLQLIRSYTELAADHVAEGEGQRYLETVLESAKDAIDLTTTARDLAEVMLGPEVDNERVSLQRALTTEVADIREAYPDVTVAVPESVPTVTVLANEMLEAVFRNILKNAVQHNDNPDPEITIRTRDHEETVEVRIADNGPGVPAGQREAIFGKGEKGLESQGTGIGLYLVQSLVENYGGEVWVEDNDPAGAVFVVELQRAGASAGTD